MHTKTDWEKTLEKHDQKRAQQKQVMTVAREPVDATPTSELAKATDNVASAIRFCGGVMLASLIISVLSAIILISMAYA